MSKELPYFKFYVNEWITGDITLEDFEVQGLFTNICAYYWSKECKLSLDMAKKKFRHADGSLFDTLINAKIMKVDSEGNLLINFLLEQKVEYDAMCVKNKKNGEKGGRPPKEETQIKPSGLILANPNITNIEEKRGEEIRKEKKIEDVVPAPTSNFLSISDCRLNYETNLTEAMKEIQKDRKISDINIKLVLDQFDRHLISDGKKNKDPADYAKHFKSWLNKFDYKDFIKSKNKPVQKSAAEIYEL